MSTQALLDALAPAGTILDKIEEDKVHISVISKARAIDTVRKVFDKGFHSSYFRAINSVVSIARSYHHLLPVDENVGQIYTELLQLNLDYLESLNSKNPVELDDDARLVVATAIAGNLTLIEGKQPYHDQVRTAYPNFEVEFI